ncbi:MAG TPA: PVC-type heme-binding CxxCH protein [Candidatus Saccharimonadales bacterium]|nr:PVC-type heme-binding CxxCH protein [Candidatus Saccharimonadales bacterium]
MKTTWLPGSLFILTGGLLCAGTFPPPFNTERDTQAGPPPAGEAVARLQLPLGFKATVFAAEPDVQNPIALAWDARGRLWVAENYTYAERGPRFELRLRDRLLILEDRDGDGRFDSRTVFTDDVQMLTSVEVGLGGVWLMCPPRLLFIPDRDGDDRPDGPPEVVLDGFTVPADNYHNFANGLRFGPDGWLYGRCGASSPGELGVPGTPATERVPMRGTLWRYHPTRHVVEVLSGGCTNPWGHDWNEHGELFFINTVNGQLWHDITGAHYVRPHTIDHNPRAYALIDQHADHWHFDTGEGWSKSRTNGSADSLGGGHAHIGMMIYQGDNWPEVYRGRLFTLNLHGRRANQEILERQGSGYVGHHGEDMIISGDPWFRGMELTTGPDGGVFVADWSDTGECHESSGVHRTSGRIYKITYGEPKRPAAGDLRKLTPGELIGLHHHANEWFARQARGELARRAAAGQDLASARKELRVQVEQETNVVWKLRALWTLHVLGGADEALLRAQLRDQNEHVRAWAIRLFTEDWPLDTVFSQRPPRAARSPSAVSSGLLAELVRLGKSDPSGLVRLVLASTLQRLPPQRRLELASELVAHVEDAKDHNLPLMIWYGLIPVADTDPSGLALLAAKCELPATRQFIARRLAEDNQTAPGALTTLLGLARSKPEPFQLDVLTGLAEAWKGMRKVPAPTGWGDWQTTLAKAADPRLRDRARELGALFGDGRALEDVKRLALDRDAELAARKAALRTLIDSRPADLRPICESLLGVTFLNVVAVRGLALFDDPVLGEKLARSYRSFHQTERGVLLEVLVSRPAFARALLADIAAGKIPRADLTAYHARQIRSHDDPALTRQLAEAWGEWREAAADKRELIGRLKQRLTPATLAGADLSRGRVAFQTACASCHRLHGEGGQVGPDLTGSGRDNLDYLLENIVDPSAAVSADFRMSVAGLKDGRVLNGIVSSTTPRMLSLKTMTDTITVERGEVESLTESKLSLMPEGLLEALSETQVRDLIAFLMHAEQVPLPAAAEASASASGR